MAIIDYRGDPIGRGYDLEKKIRIAGIVEESVVDGKGIRFTLFTQGCAHNCEGCHNPATHAFEGGQIVELYDITELLDKNPLLDGITFSGGEPFVFANELADLAAYAHSVRLNVWCYTGYTYEELIKMGEKNPDIIDFLSEIDILVDGKFEESQKNLLLKFRGSSNQRLINLKKMRDSGTSEIILLEI